MSNEKPRWEYWRYRWKTYQERAPWAHNTSTQKRGIYRTIAYLRLRRRPQGPWEGKIWVNDILVYDLERKDL